MNLSYLGRRKYAKNLAGTFGLSYVEDEDCQVPCANAHTVTVPPYYPSFTKEEDNSWFASLIHECYHHNWPADFEWLKQMKIKKKNLLVEMNNLVCDHKIESRSHGEYAGRDAIMDRDQATIVQQIFLRMNKPIKQQLKESGQDYSSLSQDKIDEVEIEQAKRHAAMCFDVMARHTWQSSMGAICPTPTLPLTQRLLSELAGDVTLLRDYVAAIEPSEQWEVAKRMVAILEDDENAGEEQEQEAQGEGQGAEGEGEGEGEGNGSGEAEEGDGEPTAGEIATSVAYEDIKVEEHPEDGASYAPLKINYKPTHNRSSYQPVQPYVLSFEDSSAEDRFGHSGAGYGSRLEQANNGKRLSDAVRKHLVALKRSRYIGNQRSGRVHKRNMWKAKVYAGMPQEQNIHRKRVASRLQDAAISVVVDQSGSMGGSKYVHAAASVVLLNEVFGKLNVPLEIIAFTDRGKPVNIIHKSFDKSVNKETLIRQLDVAANMMSCNSDGDSILWAGERLLGRKEQKKIMIVLSDGQPAGSGGTGLDGFTKDVVSALEKVVDVHGIGIEDNSVERFYSSYDVIYDSNELEKALLTVLKNKVFSGR